MRTRIAAVTVALIALFTPGAAVRAGTISEVGDAGDLPGSAQYTYGSGALDSLIGTLNDYFDADMFAIRVSDPQTFSATTLAPGTSAYDTQLFLFDQNGFGVAANDDISHSSYNPRSLLASGNPLGTLAAGTYFLAISGWDRDPHSGVNSAIFTDDTYYTATVGPSGPGGGAALTGWDGDSSINGGFGAYQVNLTGAEFVSAATPEPSALMLLAFGAARALPTVCRLYTGS